MDFVEQYNIKYNELLQKKNELTENEYNQAWYNFMNTQIQIDVDIINQLKKNHPNDPILKRFEDLINNFKNDLLLQKF